MKIGIYGGTFDPPHLGHMEAARAALTLLELDKLFLIPAKLPPHKDMPAGGADPLARMSMTERMAGGLGPNVEVLDLELYRDGKSYTSDTLEELHKQYPDDEFWLLMGTDMFLSIQTWHAAERILSLAGVAGFARTESENQELLEVQAQYLHNTYGAKVCTIQLPHIVDVSSTQLRWELSLGQGRDKLYPPVYGYILRHRLYGTHADLKHLDWPELRACSYSMVKAKRIPHIRGAEETAVHLAETWGADPDLARMAGILHDCTKYYTMEEQLNLCAAYGIELDELEQRSVKLLHAKTGAAIARDIYGAPEEVCSAIYWHTTGRADMTLLEKILYIADYMEPNRDFEGVDQLRALTETDLDGAVLLGLEMSVQEMKDRGNPLHFRTAEARDWLKGQREHE
ncbi:MAG: nicotinate (nicotinamide) nucleotide adenylyltransferase [Oscillospiraceae bacterium]|nr:nicotinate (nicotinamide) nucleotide adenylyltransferase [Oscillospiraceae bacterium]